MFIANMHGLFLCKIIKKAITTNNAFQKILDKLIYTFDINNYYPEPELN